MIERIVVAAALIVAMLAGPSVFAQSEKRASRCEGECMACPDRDDCLGRCRRCWAHCTAKGVSVGYHFYCRKACESRTKQCWR
jgi:hypothetical protein